MAMTTWNGDLTQCLKWMQQNAPNIQSLVNQKADWYQQFHTDFWTNWEKNVFNLQTANTFGLMIWCIILGVPAEYFGLFGGNVSWAFGPYRQNYVYKSTSGTVQNPNTQGGNYVPGGQSTILDLNEVRWALQLRYAAMISNGSLSFINYMLRFIFNKNQPWDFPNKNYFYVTDSTAPAQTLTPSAPVTKPLYMEYRVGANMVISAQFLEMLNTKPGMIPTCAGTSFKVIQET